MDSIRDKLPEGFKLRSVYNRMIYDHAKSRLPNKKAPGEDGIVNEVLKHLPRTFHDALHNLFEHMWETSKTPDEWKTALTVLFYKKDDRYDVNNYRPIGLLNAVYKLWTSIVTECLTQFVEEHSVLHAAQEGFRQGKNTTRQLQRLIMAMEDANLTYSPLYVLYVDVRGS